MYLHYTLEGPEGTREADEVHDFGLFTVEEMLTAFSAVGLAATYDPSGRSDKGRQRHLRRLGDSLTCIDASSLVKPKDNFRNTPAVPKAPADEPKGS